MIIHQGLCNSLLHDVIMTSTRVPELAIPIIQMLLQHDTLLLGLRLRCERFAERTHLIMSTLNQQCAVACNAAIYMRVLVCCSVPVGKLYFMFTGLLHVLKLHADCEKFWPQACTECIQDTLCNTTTSITLDKLACLLPGTTVMTCPGSWQ